MKKTISLVLCAVFAVAFYTYAAAMPERSPRVLMTEEAAEELYYSLPFDDGYAEALGISEEKFTELRNRLYTAADNFESTVNVEDFAIPYSRAVLGTIGSLLYKTPGRPELFQVQSVSCNYYPGGSLAEVIIYYNRTAEQYESDLRTCEAAAEALLSDIKNFGYTDLEKALLIHDRIVKYTEYVDRGSDDDHNIFGLLKNKTAVCEGYAQTYCYLLSKVGVDSRMVSSSALMHAWNIVTINGKKYHVDATWDDPLADVDGRARHSNFMCSTAKFRSAGAALHNASDYNSEPSDTTYDNYFWQDSDSGFELCRGQIYYIDKSGDTAKLCRFSEHGGTEELFDISDRWVCKKNGAYYPGNYSRLATDGSFLYYNTAAKIMRYDPKTETTSEVYSPDLTALSSGEDVAAIYGFKVEDGNFLITPAVSPNFTETTKAENLITAKIPAEKVFKDVWFKTLQTKTDYYIGDDFDPTGMELFARYTDGTEEPLSLSDLDIKYDFSAEGESYVTVTYVKEGYGGTFSVNVKKPSVKFSSSVLAGEIGKPLTLRAASDPEGLEVTFFTEDKEKSEISGNLITPLSEGKIKIFASITYNGVTYTDVAVLSASEKPVLGDLDGNGRADAADALTILQYSVKKITLLPEQTAVADLNGDGRVTVTDALLTLKASLAA